MSSAPSSSASTTRGDMPPAPGEPRETGSAAVRVAIVNDYEIVVAGTADILAPFASRVALVEVDVGARAPREVDVVLYDAFGQQSAELPPVEDVVPDGSSACLLVFTWHSSPDVVARARAAGAAGLVTKSATAEEIVEAIEAVHRGDSIFAHSDPDTDDLAPQSTHGWRWPGREHGLSSRESEVLAHICRGLSNQEVADRLYLGMNTVKTYIRSTYHKIGAGSRAQAVIWGLSHGFDANP